MSHRRLQWKWLLIIIATGLYVVAVMIIILSLQDTNRTSEKNFSREIDLPKSKNVLNKSSSQLQQWREEKDGGGGRGEHLAMSSNSDKLVVVAALGANSSSDLVEHNIRSHFMGWDCVVFYYVDKESKGDVSQHGSLRSCKTVRLVGRKWTHFFIDGLPKELPSRYKYIGVLLDDVYLPVEGSTRIDVKELIGQMKTHKLSSISPSIKGAVWWSTKPRLKKKQHCLWKTPTIETFVQIFGRPAFDCWRNQLEYSNPLAVCIDLCLTKLCPETDSKLAVDSRQVAYHLGYKDVTIPPDALPAGTNLLRYELMNMKRPRPGSGTLNLTLCEQHGCNTDGQTNRRDSMKKSLDCSQSAINRSWVAKN